VALFHLDEFETALEAFQKGRELRPTLAAFDTWIRKCRAEIDGGCGRRFACCAKGSLAVFGCCGLKRAGTSKQGFSTDLKRTQTDPTGELEEIKPPSPPKHTGPPKITIVHEPAPATASKPAAAKAASSAAAPSSSAAAKAAGKAAASSSSSGGEEESAPLAPAAGAAAPHKIRWVVGWTPGARPVAQAVRYDAGVSTERAPPSTNQPQPPNPKPPPPRHQWYQVGDKMVVDVFAKALTPDRFRAAFTDSRLTLTVLRDPSAPAPAAAAAASDGSAGDAAAAEGDAAAEGKADGPEWELDVELFGGVNAAACKFEILRTKVEVTLPKTEPGKAWPSLERSAAPALAMPAVGSGGGSGSGGGAAAPVAAAPAAAAGPPRVYPTSHVKGPKDWSAIETEVKEMESKGELEDGDPLNSFFKKIFSQGDEDTRRAMMKSFVESNGTVLSTNWDEVGKKKVECTPPDGMEVKKWGA
jgi:suppressor of G2 allele of SKP1